MSRKRCREEISIIDCIKKCENIDQIKSIIINHDEPFTKNELLTIIDIIKNFNENKNIIYNYFSNKILPDIACGISKPIIVRIVGAISPSFPVLILVKAGDLLM